MTVMTNTTNSIKLKAFYGDEVRTNKYSLVLSLKITVYSYFLW